MHFCPHLIRLFIYLPEWIQAYKESRAEIRPIKGTYYKYEVRYQYNKEKKRTDKITEKEGFIHSEKDELRRKSEELTVVDVKTFGLYSLFSDFMKDEIVSLKAVFGTEVAERLLSFAMMRWAYQTPIKRVTYYYAHGYNPDFDFEKQIRLMYLFSAQMKQPVYYRLINGNIPDVKSMSLCVNEMCVKNKVVFIADKGFFSSKNIKMKEEEKDYLKRIETYPESYSKDKFDVKLHQYGTLTIVYKMDTQEDAGKKTSKKTVEKPKSPEQTVYESYKQRNEIEVMFESYKNYLEADASYMQNRYVLEGWLFANFVAMIAYYKLYVRLRQAELLSKYSPEDIIEQSKAIYQMKIRSTWRRSEITLKTARLLTESG